MAANEPVDLCISSSDDDEDERKLSSATRGVDPPAAETRNPTSITDLTESDDGKDLGGKPAAQRRSRAQRKRNRRGDVINLVSLSPILPGASLARKPQREMLDFVEVAKEAPNTKTPLQRVLEVFPDVDHTHAEKVLRDCKTNLEMVLSILAERSYPKSKLYASIPKSAVGATTSVFVQRTKKQPKYDYTAPSSFEPSETYFKEAMKQLRYEFPFVNASGIRQFLKEEKKHYSIVRNRLLKTLREAGNAAQPGEDKEIQEYQNIKPVWATKVLSRKQKKSIGTEHCAKRIVRLRAPTISDPILKEEVAYAQVQLEDWMLSVEEKIRRQEARKRSENSGSGVECGCCFDRVPIEEMVACRNEGHLFCADCIQSYANTAVFSNGSLGVVKATGKPSCELLCCDSSGCQSGFHEEHLEKVLSIKTLEKYNELQFRANMEAAGMSEEICTCPKCGFQADLPPNLSVFQCPVADCRYESCRNCGKDAHVPLRCDEVVQKKRDDEGRLKVEEAMAEAKIRKCPKCQTSFVKSYGCNKMTCRCGAKMCYVCRKQLDGNNPYSHFCQRAHCKHENCGMCTLYSNAEEDDQRAMREAGLTAAQTFRDEVKEKDAKADVNIDVDQIMTKGATAPARIPAR